MEQDQNESAESMILTTPQAAAYIGVHPDTLRKWVKTGQIKPSIVTRGGHLRWDKRLLRPPIAPPCCDLARTLLMAHGWWSHDQLTKCDQCNNYKYNLRQLIDGSHICPHCDISWPFDKDEVGVHE
jgi:excisionase family DNA binding protein